MALFTADEDVFRHLAAALREERAGPPRPAMAPPTPPEPEPLRLPAVLLGDLKRVAPNGISPEIVAQYARAPGLARARDLFYASLRPNELRQFAQYRCFTVNGSNGHSYTILPRLAHNVIDHFNQRLLCAYPHGEYPVLPVWDCWLAQKLLLETDARAFERVAFAAMLQRLIG